MVENKKNSGSLISRNFREEVKAFKTAAEKALTEEK